MTAETTEQMVERIARAWYEQPCPPEEGDHCNADLHNWDTAHPEDKAAGLALVDFVLTEAGHK